MGIHAEKIYYLDNPESGVKKVATESEVKYENAIKDVFGVAFLEDLAKMICFNKKFKDFICKAHQIQENEITMDRVFRLASKSDLLPLKLEYENQYQESLNENHIISPPFNLTIQLNEGIFNWNEKECIYEKMS